MTRLAVYIINRLLSNGLHKDGHVISKSRCPPVLSVGSMSSLQPLREKSSLPFSRHHIALYHSQQQGQGGQRRGARQQLLHII